jgi:small conductance mechanosensitive channel
METSLKKALVLLTTKLIGWATVAVTMLPNLVVALIFLVIIARLSRPLAKWVERAVLRFSGYKHMAGLASGLTRLAVFTLAVIVVLGVLKLDRAVASLLAGVGILGIALGFASQDIASNFLSGVILHFTNPFSLGDLIGIDPIGSQVEILGVVETINFHSTKIRNAAGQLTNIPNKIILGNPIINYTISGARRVDLPWSVSQTEDLLKVEGLVVKAVEALEGRIADSPVELFHNKLGDYTIDMEIRFWTIPEEKVYLKARSEAIKAIKRTFEENAIPMPVAARK